MFPCKKYFVFYLFLTVNLYFRYFKFLFLVWIFSWEETERICIRETLSAVFQIMMKLCKEFPKRCGPFLLRKHTAEFDSLHVDSLE